MAVSTTPSSQTVTSTIEATCIQSILPNYAQLVSIKLDGTNFLAWIAQFLPILHSNDLLGIVDGFEPCPPKYNTEENLTSRSQFYLCCLAKERPSSS